MMSKYRFTGILLAATMLIYGFGAPAAIAIDAEVVIGSIPVTFDQTGLPAGTPYTITWTVTLGVGQPMYAGTPYTESFPASSVFSSITYPAIVSAPLGVYNFGSLSISPQASLPFTPTGPTIIIGSYVSGNITGTVFWDYNDNHIQDPGEPGIPNAPVELLGAIQPPFVPGGLVDAQNIGALAILLTTTSGADGTYAFNFLPAGTFSVRATLPDGSLQESLPITLAVTGGVMNSGQANFSQTVTLPYTGK